MVQTKFYWLNFEIILRGYLIDFSRWVMLPKFKKSVKVSLIKDKESKVIRNLQSWVLNFEGEGMPLGGVIFITLFIAVFGVILIYLARAIGGVAKRTSKAKMEIYEWD